MNTYCPRVIMSEKSRDPLGSPPCSSPAHLGSTMLLQTGRPVGARACRAALARLGGSAQPHRGPPAPAALPGCPQVKELGAIIYNCSRLAQDLEKTFQTYWALGTPRAVLPKPWPRNFSSHINRCQPLRDHFDGLPTPAYFSVWADRPGGPSESLLSGWPHSPEVPPTPGLPCRPWHLRGPRSGAVVLG